MDAETCCLCRKAPLKFVCFCIFPPLPVCEKCISQHLESDEPHMPLLFRRQPPKAAGSDVEICDDCKIVPAVRFCLCSTPVKKYCDDCDKKHYSKTPDMVHYRHPIALFKTVSSGTVSIEKFRKRQTYIERLQFRLNENLAQFDNFVKKVERDFDDLIRTCREKKESSLRELQVKRRTLVEALNQAQQVIVAKRYQEGYEPTTWFEDLLQDGYFSIPTPYIQLFAAKIDFGNTYDLISKSVFSELSLESLQEGLVDTLPVVKSNRLWLFNTKDLGKSESTLNIGTNINGSTAYCFIKLYTLFCCGGDNHAETYEVNVKTNQAVKLNNMSTVRRYHGIWKNQDSVYVFGGHNTGTHLQSAEKYSLSTKTWTALRGSLIKPQWAITVCEHCTGIYLSGADGGSNYIELFNPETETFKQLLTKSGAYMPCLLALSDEMFWIHADTIDVVKISGDINSLVISDSKPLPRIGNGHYWTNFYVSQKRFEFVGVLNPSGSPSGLFKFCS